MHDGADADVALVDSNALSWEPCYDVTSRAQRSVNGLQALTPVTFDVPLDEQKQVGPDGLRTSEPSPQRPGQRVGQDQDGRGENKESRDQVEILWPGLDEEGMEPSVREIQKDRLTGGVRPSIPSDERSDVVDRQRQRQDGSLDPPKPAFDGLRHDGLAGRRCGLRTRLRMIDLDGERHLRTFN